MANKTQEFSHNKFMKKFLRAFSLFFVAVFCLSIFGVLFIDARVARAEEVLDTKIVTVMYHSVLNGTKGRYIVSEKQLENDLIALKENGFVSVTAEEIVAYSEGRGLLPKKPVFITFDDGHYNNLFYAEKILKKHGFTAVVNVVGAYSEHSATSGDDKNPNYSHITWDEMAETAKRGVIYFGNHSYSMHKFKPRYGIAQKPNESDEEYARALSEDTMKLHEKIKKYAGYDTVVYAYPFGKYSVFAKDTLKNLGYKITLTCNEGVTTARFNVPDSVIFMRRINREGTYSTKEFINVIKKYYSR